MPRKICEAFFYLAERGGFAYIPQAAVGLACPTLRISRAMSAGTSLLSKMKMPRKLSEAFFYLAERGGFFVKLQKVLFQS